MSAKEHGTDYLLVEAARNGNPSARETLGRQVGRAAYVFALQLTGQRETALDVAQDAVLSFFKHLGRFDAARPIEPWLYQIVRNRVRDLARREQLRRHESLEMWLDQGRLGVSSAAADPSAEVEQRDLQQRIWKSVSRLSASHREIFVLRDFQGLSYREIAEVLSIPRGTVMSRLHAARVSLRALLTEEGVMGPHDGRERNHP